jgi:septal ring factor EnvC (AmiA/AmiB activator)
MLSLAELLVPTQHPIVGARIVALMSDHDEEDVDLARIDRWKAELRRVNGRLATAREKRDELAKKYRRGHPDLVQAQRAVGNLATRSSRIKTKILRAKAALQ